MNDLFCGTRALVTGASRGLGAEFARRLAARGVNLVLTARSEPELEELARQLYGEHGVDVQVVTGDLAADQGARRLCESVDALGLEIDHVVNNAGFGLLGKFVDRTLEEQQRMVRLNCEALLVVSRWFAPRLVEKGSGGIIHLASVAGFQPAPYIATYAATKAFVLSLSVGLTEEFRGTGVRCLALCPGPVETNFQQVAGIELGVADQAMLLSPQETVARALKAYEAGKDVLVPGAVNKLSTFLSSRVLPRKLVLRAVGKLMSGNVASPQV